jgi:hypothetical protein
MIKIDYNFGFILSLLVAIILLHVIVAKNCYHHKMYLIWTIASFIILTIILSCHMVSHTFLNNKKITLDEQIKSLDKPQNNGAVRLTLDILKYYVDWMVQMNIIMI